MSLEQDGDADYAARLDALRREEELIHEEAKEAAAYLKADLPVILPGQVVLSPASASGPCCRGSRQPLTSPRAWQAAISVHALLGTWRPHLQQAWAAERVGKPAEHATPCGQNAQEATAAAAAAAVVREAAAAAVVDVLDGESAEERASKLAAAKEGKMRKVIRCGAVRREAAPAAWPPSHRMCQHPGETSVLSCQ